MSEEVEAQLYAQIHHNSSIEESNSYIENSSQSNMNKQMNKRYWQQPKIYRNNPSLPTSSITTTTRDERVSTVSSCEEKFAAVASFCAFYNFFSLCKFRARDFLNLPHQRISSLRQYRPQLMRKHQQQPNSCLIHQFSL